MKIALCSPTAGPAAEPFDPVLDLAGELAGRGQPVHLFTSASVAAAPAVEVHTIASGDFARGCAAAVGAAGPFDVVHAFSGAWRPGVEPAPHVFQLLGGTVAQSIEQCVRAEPTAWRRRLRRFRNLFAFGRLRELGTERDLFVAGPTAAIGASGPKIVVPSHYVAAQLRQFYKLPDERIRVIYEGLDPRRFPEDKRGEQRLAVRKKMNVGERETVVLCAIREPRGDGLREALTAAAAVKADLAAAPGKKSFRLIVFPLDRRADIERTVRGAGLGDIVRCADPETSLGDCLAAADVFLSPDYDDPAGRRLLTALAWQLPCVTTRFNGAAELLEDGQSGYIVDSPDDVKSLANRVVMLTESIKRYKFRGNLKDIAESAGVKRFADDVLLLYTKSTRPGAK
jgi:glycosyltransferase involved in cell wall biosynthesis